MMERKRQGLRREETRKNCHKKDDCVELHILTIMRSKGYVNFKFKF